MSKAINRIIERSERPDKALFIAMMGAFFLCLSVAPAYWAYYNYGENQRATAFVQNLRKSSDQSLTPNEREERKNRIALNSSMADRYKLEMILSGAGGLVLFVFSLLLFRSALKARSKKQSPQFETIDWRSTPMPAQRVEVRYKRIYDVLFAFIIIFFGGLTLLNFTQTLLSKFSTTSDILVKGILFNGFCLLIIFAISILMIRAKRKAVLLFDVSGITRSDGRHFAWNEFQGVITQIDVNQLSRNRYVWRIELACADGERAWIIPNRVKNIGEVMNFISSLPGKRLKIRA